MNRKTSPFQIILFVVLGVAIIVGVLVFSVQRSSTNTKKVEVSIWGTLDEDIIRGFINEINKIEKNTVNVVYTQFSDGDFEEELVEALAADTGPDLVFMSTDLLMKHENKLFNIEYDFYPQQDYKQTFIEAGDVLLKADGITGLPFVIDPLVMYWNRTALNNEGFSQAPSYWDEVVTQVPQLVDQDTSFNIKKAGIALGELRNIKHGKQILITLIMQAGNPIIFRNPDETRDRKFISSLDDRLGYALKPAEAAVTFFTQFSNPTKKQYSWNRALPISEEMFLTGDLAFYLGYASEYSVLQRKNPNLNFDVAVVPQSRSGDAKSVNANLIFIGIVKSSPNIASAFDTMITLTNNQNIGLLSTSTNLPPVRRDLLAAQNSSAALQTFNDSAIISKVFLDPNPSVTDTIFVDMVESFTSGRSSLSQAILRANSQINAELR